MCFVNDILMQYKTQVSLIPKQSCRPGRQGHINLADQIPRLRKGNPQALAVFT